MEGERREGFHVVADYCHLFEPTSTEEFFWVFPFLSRYIVITGTIEEDSVQCDQLTVMISQNEVTVTVEREGRGHALAITSLSLAYVCE